MSQTIYILNAFLLETCSILKWEFYYAVFLKVNLKGDWNDQILPIFSELSEENLITIIVNSLSNLAENCLFLHFLLKLTKNCISKT